MWEFYVLCLHPANEAGEGNSYNEYLLGTAIRSASHMTAVLICYKEGGTSCHAEIHHLSVIGEGRRGEGRRGEERRGEGRREEGGC